MLIDKFKTYSLFENYVHNVTHKFRNFPDEIHINGTMVIMESDIRFQFAKKLDDGTIEVHDDIDSFSDGSCELRRMALEGKCQNLYSSVCHYRTAF